MLNIYLLPVVTDKASLINQDTSNYNRKLADRKIMETKTKKENGQTFNNF